MSNMNKRNNHNGETIRFPQIKTQLNFNNKQQIVKG